MIIFRSTAYTAYATAFNGSSQYLRRTTDFTGAANSKIILVSLWFKYTTTLNSKAIMYFRIGGLKVAIDFDVTTLKGMFRDLYNNQAATFTSNATYTEGQWYHLCISFNSANSAQRAVYLDGASISGLSWSSYSNYEVFLAGYITEGLGVGADVDGNWKWSGALSEVWFSGFETSWFDITNATNLQKFRSAAGKPVDLGVDGSTPTGTKPLFYLKSPYSSFETNATGRGDFATVGGPLSTATAP
jgi:hypothetical protein